VSREHVAGIILAAGRSRRMGYPKALLPVGQTTFVGRLVSVAREAGLAPVRIVVGDAATAVAVSYPLLAPLLVRNDAPDLGQLHSLRLGLRAVGPECRAAVVFPVDHPLVAVSTVAALVAAHRGGRGVIVLPVHSGRRGHPVLFGREVFGELGDGPLEGGARRIVRADPGRVVEIPVDDPGIITDIDTPEEYRAAVGYERPD
jgi:molybdenum cofactor cytidylyltransferase